MYFYSTKHIPQDLLFVELRLEEKRVSTGALQALDNVLVVQTKVWKSGWVPVQYA